MSGVPEAVKEFPVKVWVLPWSVHLVLEHANKMQTLLSSGSFRARFFFLCVGSRSGGEI